MHGLESNSWPVDHKSNALTTKLPTAKPSSRSMIHSVDMYSSGPVNEAYFIN